METRKKELEEYLGLWFVIGMIVCIFPTIIISDTFDFAINGARLFSVNDNPFFNPDEIPMEYRDEAIEIMQSMGNTWGNPNAFIDTNFPNFKIPNITNIGVLLAMCLYCIFLIYWNIVGKKIIGRFCHCKFNKFGEVIEYKIMS